MKKITFTLLVLTSLSAFSQTVLVNYDDVPSAFQFCFDAPDPDECTSTVEANDDTTGDNPSAMYWESIAPTEGGPFNYGLGVEFSLATLPTLNNNGSYLAFAFRSSENPTGSLPITAQLWANDNDKIDAFSEYTNTDGSWQIIQFDYTGSTPTGAFTNDTEILRLVLFIDEGAASGFTYGIDEASLNTEPLSVNDFEINDVSVWPNPAKDMLNVQGNFLNGNIQIFDLYGKVVSTEKNIVNNNEINISNLSKGVYFLKFENGSIHKFIKG